MNHLVAPRLGGGLSVVLAVLLATPSYGADVLESDQKTLAEIVDYADSTAIALGGCPYAVLVSRQGQILHESYSSGQEGAAPLGAIGPESRWPLFSTTKSYGAALLLSLDHDGVLSLDDPVSKHLAEFRTHGEGEYDRRDVTLRHLASHSSGIEFPEAAWDAATPDLAAIRVVTPPGQIFHYSGQGMHVLEKAIEAAAGVGYPDLLRDRILQPLGLDATGYEYRLDPERRMLPVRPAEPGKDPSDAYALSDPRVHVHSGLYASARDHHRFAGIWLGEGSFEGRTYWAPARQREVWSHHSTRPSDGGRYGLLWWLFEDENGYVMSGSGAKATAVAPGTDVAVTILRLPLTPSPGPYNFYQDKLALVHFANRLGDH